MQTTKTGRRDRRGNNGSSRKGCVQGLAVYLKISPKITVRHISIGFVVDRMYG